MYNEVEMTFAIYHWITHHVTFDTRAFHHRRQANLTASWALSQRKTIAEGYAELFKAMCDIARIECVKIDGFAKAHPEFISAVDDDNRHSWNAVKIKNTWYYIDATWGAGYVSSGFRDFVQEYSDAWFFTKRQLFLLSHFPDDKKWQLTDDPINKSEFTHAPTVHTAAIVYQVVPTEGLRGRIRGKEGDCKRVVLLMGIPGAIQKAEVEVEGQRLPAEMYKQGNVLSVDLPLPDDGSYPLRLYLNNAPAIGFKAEVSKSKRKP
jgi:hypothetical protein